MRATFDARPIDLQLATTQAAVLDLFNDAPGETLTYAQVKARSGLDDADAARVLASLSVLKHKILAKTPDTRRVSPTDTFAVNPGFTDRMRRVRVPLPTVEDKKRVVEDVAKDRTVAVDAAIVRVMKARKALTHHELVGEVVKQLSRVFKPDMRLIKKQVEHLIEQEYLERDPDKASAYRYLA